MRAGREGESVLVQMLVYLPGMVLPRLAAFAVLLAATHLLAEEAVGLLALVFLLGEICEGIFLNWLRIALLRHGTAAGIGRQIRLWALPCLLAALVLATGLAPMLAGERSGSFLGAVAAYVLGISLLKFGLARLQLGGRQMLYAGIEGGRALLTVPGAVIAMQITGDGLAVSLVVSGLAALAGGLALLAGGAGEAGRGAPMRLAGMAGPLIVLAALNLVMVSADRLVLGFAGSSAALGVYAASYALARQGFDIVSNAAHAGGFPALVVAEARGMTGERLAQQAVLVLSLLFCLCAALVLARQDLVEALLPESYRAEAALLIPIIAAGALALNIKTSLTDTVLLLAGQHWRQALGLGAGAGLALLIAALLVPPLGGTGAALGFAGGSFACLALSWWQARQVLRLEVTQAMLVGIGLPVLMVVAVWGGIAIVAEGAWLRLALLGLLGGPAMLWALARHFSPRLAHG